MRPFVKASIHEPEGTKFRYTRKYRNDVGRWIYCSPNGQCQVMTRNKDEHGILPIGGPGNDSTAVVEFIILGFSGTEEMHLLLFVIFLVIYLATIAGNSTIIFITIVDLRLQSPMYFFLRNLSLLEIVYTTVTQPLILANLLGSKRVLFTGCVLQMYIFISLASTECFLLAVMSYDRFSAICHPLLYQTVMNSQFCTHLVLGVWLAGFFAPSVQAVLIYRLSFCGRNEVNHFVCDVAPLLKLACSDTSRNELVAFTMGAFVTLGSLACVSVSYVRIIVQILRIPSSSGRRKTFSTCASHLAVVGVYFGTVIAMYVRPTSQYSLELDRIAALLYVIVTPLLNPIIYSFRNKEVKGALHKVLLKV
ncbi:olfactory receptor 5V1-like [Ambystoma mexicanum]|uniref:olfactory receptor 5V1-like n=1 Tax=Ambystoma mexicanum TaxID=8296 RepID=UPI0037E8A1B2